MNILLLEDDKAFAQALQIGFTKKSHNLLHVETTEDLLVEAVKQGFDLVLLDLKLAHETSLASIAPLREILPKSKIFMLTGYASIATTVEAIKLGADDYLPKPVTVAEILKAYAGDATELEIETMSPKRLEWEHIQRVLQENDGNISRTAQQLNMHRRTLQRKLQKKPTRL